MAGSVRQVKFWRPFRVKVRGSGLVLTHAVEEGQAEPGHESFDVGRFGGREEEDDAEGDGQRVDGNPEEGQRQQELGVFRFFEDPDDQEDRDDHAGDGRTDGEAGGRLDDDDARVPAAELLEQLVVLEPIHLERDPDQAWCDDREGSKFKVSQEDAQFPGIAIRSTQIWIDYKSKLKSTNNNFSFRQIKAMFWLNVAIITKF